MSPATKPTRMPGRLERFDSELNASDVLVVGTAGFEHAAGRRLAGVDFRVAFVAEDEEAVAVGERLQLCEVSWGRDGALRIGRRSDVERNGARQQALRDDVEVRKKAVLLRRRQHHGLAAGSLGAGAVDRVERVRHQDRRRALAWRDVALRRDRGKEQAFAAAVEHEDLALRIEWAWQLEASRQPARLRPCGKHRCPWRSGSGRIRRYIWPAPGRRNRGPGAVARQAIARSTACRGRGRPRARPAARTEIARARGQPCSKRGLPDIANANGSMTRAVAGMERLLP